jgi:Subtilase family
MSKEQRRQRLSTTKHELLDRYLAEGQLAAFDPDAENVFYVPNQLIVAARVMPQVESRLDRYGAKRGWGTVRLTRAGLSHDLPAGASSDVAPPPVYVLDPKHRVNTAELALELSEKHGGGVGLNHLATGLQRHSGWPDGDPELASEPLPRMPSPAPRAGSDVTLAIVDTGWPSRMPPHLNWFDEGCEHGTAPGEVDDRGHPLRHIDHLDEDRDGYLDVEAGHGLFVAGIVRRLAPSARLVFLKALNSDGMGTELGVARAIQSAVNRGADVINLSLGFYTLRNATPTGVEAEVAEARSKGAVLVGAAGNDHVEDPTYPAALPGVIGVGALDVDGSERADFSNHGDWVNVYAPGEEVQSTFVRGREDPALAGKGDADRFRSNTALWSGTSFACAHVSGYLAAKLSEPRPQAQAGSLSDRADALIADLPAALGARRLVAEPAF